MNKYKIVLFDLDGTISDSKVGITKSVQYALEKFNIIETDLDKLECFIGPPLLVSFQEFYGLDENKARQAVDYYRECFAPIGIYENELYPEIPNLLKVLKEKDYTLAIATSKPTIFSEKILKHFNIDKYFDIIVGSNLDGTRNSKTEVIQYILDYYTEYNKCDFIMIGDRKHDIIGANNTGIHSIGVTYSYGSYEEHQNANATYIINNIEEIINFFNSHLSI